MQEPFDELPDVLKKIKSSSEGLRTPDGYFEQFNDRMMDRLHQEGLMTDRTSGVRWRTWVNIKSMSAAAAVTALLVAGWWWWQQPTPSAVAPLAQVEPVELTPDIAAEYIQANLEDFDEELLAVIGEMDEDVSPAEPEPPNPAPKKSKKIESEELDQLLDDLTEEEIEEML
jgi:hypothetical protein